MSDPSSHPAVAAIEFSLRQGGQDWPQRASWSKRDPNLKEKKQLRKRLAQTTNKNIKIKKPQNPTDLISKPMRCHGRQRSDAAGKTPATEY